MFLDTSITDIFFRLGLVIMISGIMLGLIFGEWTILILLGALLTFSPLIKKSIYNREETHI